MPKKLKSKCKTCLFGSTRSVMVFSCSSYLPKPFLIFKKPACPTERKLEKLRQMIDTAEDIDE